MATRSEQAPAAGDGAEAEFEHGNRLAHAGDLRAAEAAYRQADEQGHGTAAAYAGLFGEARGALDEARDAYRRADERGDGYGAFRLGMLDSRAGDWDAASAAWARAEERGHAQPPFDPVSLAPATAAAGPMVPPTDIQRGAFANPVLIGAITVLVAIVAVFLAYNADGGLPFVPTRELKVDIASGAALVAGNEVEQGGYQIGMVSAMEPIRLADGSVGTQLTLALNESNGRVPVDSTAQILPRSVLGLKYLNLVYGHSSRVFADGATMPIAQTRVPVQFDDIDTMFDARTRPAVEQNLVGFGDALAARGSALNDTIASLPALFGHLEPVAAYLSDPRTGLSRLLGALNGFFSTVAPVSGVNARLFGDQATAFAAISKSPLALEQTIRFSPPTLAVATASLRAQQPFLVDLTALSRALAPATAELRAALPNINPALAAGVRVLPRTPALNRQTESVLASLKALARDPGSDVALNGLYSTVSTVNPIVRYLGPYVTTCNEWNYFWVELADLVSEQTQFGMAQRALINFGNQQTNNVGKQGATQPADGYQPGDLPGASGTADAEYLHGPAYGAAVDNNGNADCEVGQRGYPAKLNYSDPKARSLDTDPHTPGDQGTTWTGLARVPAGETYSRNPLYGPQLPFNPLNP
jgi:ABC-type transporter Mla subunit MlaD